ncbi:MAG: response regulator [Candidatus Omnitrophica bacterium]|nr:response regulator [Candidatus Omnitrophota bacterium]
MKKMLVIEDEPFIVEPLEFYVRDEMKDFKFFKASTGEEGIRIIEREHPDLLILDMKLDPFMDGINVLRQMQSELSRMAVIVLTGFVDPHMETEARKLGVDAYLEKPIYLDQLRKVIEEVLARRNKLDRDRKDKK